MRGQKHLDLTNKSTYFFSNTNKPSSTETSSTKSQDSAICTRKQSTFEVSPVTTEELMTVIRWAIDSVIRG